MTDTEGTGPAQDYFPQQPILAGYGTNDSELYATGVDWTCAGPRYPAGHAPASPLPPPVVSSSAAPTGAGYVLADASGAVDTHGDIAFHGDMAGSPLNAPVVGIAGTPDGGGYWEVASDGGVFTFGDANFYGSMGGRPLNAPVVGIAGTPDGGGYWEVASDGGVFTFGDAPFEGAD